MTSELRVDNLKGSTTGGSINVLGEGTSATTNLQQGLAKGWAELDGDASTVVAFDSFNVTSIDDDGTGRYTFHLTNSMSNSNYCMASNAARNAQVTTTNRSASAAAEDSNSVLLGLRDLSNNQADAEHIGCVILGDLT